MKARIIVTLKAGVLDPQGKAIEGALTSLGIAGVASVRQGKIFDVDVSSGPEAAEDIVTAACERLLANTVVENYRIVWDEAPAPVMATPDVAQETAPPVGMPAEGNL